MARRGDCDCRCKVSTSCLGWAGGIDAYQFFNLLRCDTDLSWMVDENPTLPPTLEFSWVGCFTSYRSWDFYTYYNPFFGLPWPCATLTLDPDTNTYSGPLLPSANDDLGHSLTLTMRVCRPGSGAPHSLPYKWMFSCSITNDNIQFPTTSPLWLARVTCGKLADSGYFPWNPDSNLFFTRAPIRQYLSEYKIHYHRFLFQTPNVFQIDLSVGGWSSVHYISVETSPLQFSLLPPNVYLISNRYNNSGNYTATYWTTDWSFGSNRPPTPINFAVSGIFPNFTDPTSSKLRFTCRRMWYNQWTWTWEEPANTADIFNGPITFTNYIGQSGYPEPQPNWGDTYTKWIETPPVPTISFGSWE